MKNLKEHSNMINNPDAPYEKFNSFEELFEQARQRLDYWVEGAKIEFTEKIVERMGSLEISRKELADRLGKKQSHVTRLLGGSNNFTIETMVQIAEALDCHFRCHLEPSECETVWINVLREKPELIGNELEEPKLEPNDEDANLTLAA